MRSTAPPFAHLRHGTEKIRRVARALAVLGLLAAASPIAAQGYPLGGTISVSLTAGTAVPGQNFPVALLVDMTNAWGSCGDKGTLAMTLGAYNLGVTYDSTALQYVGISSCGVAQFAGPVCSDHGTFVNCNDANTGNTLDPRGFVCVARLTFRSLTMASSELSLLTTPSPRGIASNLLLGCGGPATFPAASIVTHPITVIPTATRRVPVPAPLPEPIWEPTPE